MDLANKESVGSCQGIHKYVLQLHFRNHLANFSFVKCPMFLMLLVLPMLYISLVIQFTLVKQVLAHDKERANLVLRLIFLFSPRTKAS